MNIAIITGIRGGDGSYLADLLIGSGYKVIGIERRSSSPNYKNIEHLFANNSFVLEQGDITDFGSIVRIIKKHKPTEFYNFAALSSPAASWDQPAAVCDINFTGVSNCLEAIRLVSPDSKFFQASTSEIYGEVNNNLQDEETSPNPRSPYGVTKLAAESLVKTYRNQYNLFTCFARAFNHTSERHSNQFIIKKITSAVAAMIKSVNENQYNVADNQTTFETALSNGFIQPIHLGNLDAKRDFTHAQDIMRGIYSLMQLQEPEDVVLASGETHTIRDILDICFSFISIYDWSSFVVVDSKYYRPAEKYTLCGDYSKAKRILKWEPQILFKDMIQDILRHDISLTMSYS